MLAILPALQAVFEEHLRNKAIPNNLQGPYKRCWSSHLDSCLRRLLPRSFPINSLLMRIEPFDFAQGFQH